MRLRARSRRKTAMKVKYYFDVCDVKGAEVEPVDVITFGSPCQDLSIAGKRAGLKGERSGLFTEAVRIIKEMRKNDEQNGRASDAFKNGNMRIVAAYSPRWQTYVWVWSKEIHETLFGESNEKIAVRRMAPETDKKFKDFYDNAF